MKNSELKQWLRDNSSGIYKPSKEAADRISELERTLTIMVNSASMFQETAKAANLRCSKWPEWSCLEDAKRWANNALNAE